MHKNDFCPLYFFHITRFHSVTSNSKSFSPAATLDPRPRHWTRDRVIGPATATLDPRPATRDPRPTTISQTRCGRVFAWTLIVLRSNIIKNLLCVSFSLMVLSMCNLQKRLIRAAFWVLLQAMFTERLKTNCTAIIKVTKETTNYQQKKCNSVKHIQRQQFSFTKRSIKVSLEILSLQAYF